MKFDTVAIPEGNRARIICGQGEIKNYFHTEFRSCYVDDQKAVFHRWVDRAHPVPGGLTVGSHPGGQVQYTDGLVEFEDGTIRLVEPFKIRFCDSMVSQFHYPDKEDS